MSNKFLTSVSAVDKTAEREGVEIEYMLKTGESFRLTILRSGSSNAAFMRVAEEKLRKYRRTGTDIAKLPIEVQRKLNADIYGEGVVVGWNEEDFGAPYNVGSLKAAFEADPDFLDFVMTEAGSSALFHKVVTEDAAKN